MQRQTKPTHSPPPDDVAKPKSMKTTPLLRGVFHGLGTLISLISGPYIVYCAPDTVKIPFIIYALGVTTCLFASSMLHLPDWSHNRNAYQLMKRIDHAMIFFLITGSYTPFIWIVVKKPFIFYLIWGVGIVGLLLKVIWVHMPKYLSILPYLLLGWMVLLDLETVYLMWSVLPLGNALLLIGCGVVFTIGGLCYGLQRPTLIPGVLGYHEIFHIMVIIGCGMVYASLFFYVLPYSATATDFLF